MKRFVIYNKLGEILRAGGCRNADFKFQAHEGEFIIEGHADSINQKIINGKIVNKTPEEKEAEKPQEPEPTPFEQQGANITNAKWQNVLDRLDKLESA